MSYYNSTIVNGKDWLLHRTKLVKKCFFTKKTPKGTVSRDFQTTVWFFIKHLPIGHWSPLEYFAQTPATQGHC